MHPGLRYRMQNRSFIAGWLPLLAATLLACNAEKTASTTCVGNDPSCGAACNQSHPCPAGLYCTSAELCGKDCDANNPCGGGATCSTSGECKGAGADSGGGAGTAGGGGGGGGLPGDGGLDFGNDGIMLPDASGQDLTPPDAQVCAESDVVAGRVTPTVILIIDQSSSMDEQLGTSGTRWNVLRDFLLKDDGLIKSLEDRVRFGVAMYSARSDDPPDVCPLVTSVNPAINNHAAIAQTYRNTEPIEDTPTGDSIDKIVSAIPQPAPDAPREPVVLVLATDGEPDRCEELDPQTGEAQAETIAAVERAFALGIKTFVIGVGDEISTAHQQDVANAGVGSAAGQNAPYWTADDDQTLRTALTDIIGAQVSCDIALKGAVEGDPCAGTVTLSGRRRDCKDKDGWELIDSTHVRLLGASCEEFKREEVSTLRITFPCSAVRLE